jgi:aminoglycoside phosphotransferase family enzyme
MGINFEDQQFTGNIKSGRVASLFENTFILKENYILFIATKTLIYQRKFSMQNEQLPDFVNFLLKPNAYDPASEAVKLVQTHISYVFITDAFVYKFKKPVDFGFLDFSTPAKRHQYCQQELILNRRLCPSIYLDLVALEKTDGNFMLVNLVNADMDKTVEFGVKMKRMPEERMMANVIRSGELTAEMLDAICNVLVPFYAKAEGGTAIQKFGRPDAVSVNIFENFSQTETFIGSKSLSKSQFGLIKNFSEQFLQQDDLFAERISADRIRDCHGDLYSANICLADKVYIFDCIEFNERFRYCDVASDIAFLAMDLDFHGLQGLSEQFVNRFVEQSADNSLKSMLNFYKCYRAYVRGKINLFTASAPEVDMPTKEQCQDMAGKYFLLAEQYAA